MSLRSRALEYLRGKKSFRNYLESLLFPRLAAKKYHDTVGLTRGVLAKEIDVMEERFADKLDLSNITAYVHEIADKMRPDISLYFPYHICLYLLCRLFKPNLVVETGVERGSSTFMLLKAIKMNGFGVLHSIEISRSVRIAPNISADLASVAIDSEDFSSLKLHWQLHIGNSTEVLPRLTSELGKIDMFIHGSDHTYDLQKQELLIAKNWIKQQGVVIVDRPDYNSFRALDEVFPSDKYARYSLPERSDRSPLQFSVVTV